MNESQTPVIRDADEATFEAEVLQASRVRPVVVDFWAAWCGPCHQLSPTLERVAAQHAGEVDLVKVDVDRAPGLARRYGVQGIPAVKAFRNGQVVAEFVGVQPEQRVQQFFAALAPTDTDRLVAAAAADGQRREALLRQALEADPGHEGAILALADLLAERGEDDEARALLQRIPTSDDARRVLARLNLSASPTDDVDDLRARAEGGDAAAALELGRTLGGRGDYEEALSWLIAAVRDPATREAARELVLEVFALLGDDHELVRRWRPKLAAALF